MFRRTLFFLMTLMLMLSGCNSISQPTSGNSAAQEISTIRLPMGYIPNVQYAPLYVADAKGYFEDVGIEIQFDYSTETDGIALVGAEELQFSLGSGEQVLLARAQGLPVVYVLAWWQDYPVAVASLQSAGIVQPQDLAGKKIGLPGLFGANYIGLRALLGAFGMREEDITLESIGFNQVEALVAGRTDAVVIYANNEPIQLQRQGYSVDLIRVADSVHLASNGLITNEATIADQPELVARMARAMLRGITTTIANPEEAFAICAKYVDGLTESDQVVQMEILEASIEFWKAEQVGVSNPLAWENMQQVLLDIGLLAEPLDLSKAYTNRFILENSEP